MKDRTIRFVAAGDEVIVTERETVLLLTRKEIAQLAVRYPVLTEKSNRSSHRPSQMKKLA